MLAAIERDLREHYRRDYLVLKARSGEEALHAILDSMKEFFPCQSVAVVFVDDDTKELRIKISRHISYTYAKSYRRGSPGPAESRVVLEQQPLLIAEADPGSEVYAEILRSRTLQEDLVRAFQLERLYGRRGMERTLKELSRHVKVSIGQSGLIVVHVEDREPRRAADMANRLVDGLDRFNRETFNTRAKRTREFLEKRVTDAQVRLRESEAALTAYERSKGAVAADAAVVGNVITEEALGQCTSCGACESICPVGIEHLQMLGNGTSDELQLNDDFGDNTWQIAPGPAILVAGPRHYFNPPRLIHNGKSLEAVWHRAALDLLAASKLSPRSLIAGLGDARLRDLLFFDIETTGLSPYDSHVTTVALYDGSSVRTYVRGDNLDAQVTWEEHDTLPTGHSSLRLLFLMQNASNGHATGWTTSGTVLALPAGGGCLMRSLTVRRSSLTAGLMSLTATAAQALNLDLQIPIQQLQLAWTLTRVLLQL